MVDIPILSDIYDAVEDVVSGISDLPSHIWNALKNGFDAFITAITSVLQAIYGFVKAIAHALVSIVETLWGGLNTIANKVKEALHTAIKVIKEAIDKLWHLIIGVLEWFGDKLLGVVHWIWNTIYSAIRGLASWVLNILHSLLYEVGGLFSNAVNRGIDAIPDMITADLGIIGIWDGVNTIKSAKEWRDVKLGLFKMLGLPVIGWVAGELMRGLIPSFVGRKRLTPVSLISNLTPVNTVTLSNTTLPQYGYEVGRNLHPVTVYLSANPQVEANVTAILRVTNPARISALASSDTRVYWSIEANQSNVTANVSVEANVVGEVANQEVIKANVSVDSNVVGEVNGYINSIDINAKASSEVSAVATISTSENSVNLVASVLSNTELNASIEGILNELKVNVNAVTSVEPTVKTITNITVGETATTSVKASLGATYNNVQITESINSNATVGASLVLSSGGGGGGSGSGY